MDNLGQNEGGLCVALVLIHQGGPMQISNRFEFQVDGVVYEGLWQDRGSEKRLTIFKDNRTLGHKIMAISNDEGQGVLEYAVRSLEGRSKFVLKGA